MKRVSRDRKRNGAVNSNERSVSSDEHLKKTAKAEKKGRFI